MEDIAMQIEGNIDILKGKLKKKYGSLTDDDLIYQKGMDDEFIGRLQTRLGKTKAEIRHEITKLLDS
ncbi:CsbD family protein [Fulvivirga lutimaris]|uniref:CsbD family protein n=1 Tax=Fulvivirga lutimaris TaxID=1819566 RepID=UPI001FE50CBD|nr:CsbD family protein [Fulvivirga lutimaris]